MKKVIYIFIFTVLAFFSFNINEASAKNLTVDEVAKQFVQSLQSKELALDAKVNTESKSLDIYYNEEKVSSFAYGDDYIEFDNRNSVASLDNVEENFINFIIIKEIIESVLTLSGYENKTISESVDLNSYDIYGIQMEVESYKFNVDFEDGGSMESSGDYLKYFKMSLNTEKIDALMKEYGEDIANDGESYSEEILNLVPKIKATNITDSSLTLFVKVEDNSVEIPDDLMCDIYQSTSLNGNYEKMDWSVNCSGGIGIILDKLKSNTTYYYKTVITGGSKFSDPIEVTTKTTSSNEIPNTNKEDGSNTKEETIPDSTVESPQTGNKTYTVIILGIVVLIGTIYYFLRNKNIMKKI